MDNYFKKLGLVLWVSNNLISVALAGGVDIGGGNAPGAVPVSKVKIQNALNVFHQHRRELMTSLWLIGMSSKRTLAIESKLEKGLDSNERKKALTFSSVLEILGGEKINLAVDLNKVSLSFKDSEPCLDNLGLPNDASVQNIEPSLICFSLNRLEQKLNESNFEIELLSLYLHELSHIYGSDEALAGSLQSEIRALGGQYVTYLPFLRSDFTLPVTLESLNQMVSNINPTQGTVDDVCHSIDTLNRALFDSFRTLGAETIGQAVFGIRGVIDFHSAFVVASYLQDFCEPAFSLRRILKFSTEKSAPIKDLYPDPTLILAPLGHDQALKLSAFLFADLGEGVVYATSYHDRKNLMLNLLELKSFILKLTLDGLPNVQ